MESPHISSRNYFGSIDLKNLNFERNKQNKNKQVYLNQHLKMKPVDLGFI